MNINDDGILYDQPLKYVPLSRIPVTMQVISKPHYKRLKARIKELETERDTLKAALERIRDGSSTAWHIACKALEDSDV